MGWNCGVEEWCGTCEGGTVVAVFVEVLISNEFGDGMNGWEAGACGKVGRTLGVGMGKLEVDESGFVVPGT